MSIFDFQCGLFFKWQMVSGYIKTFQNVTFSIFLKSSTIIFKVFAEDFFPVLIFHLFKINYYFYSAWSDK